MIAQVKAHFFYCFCQTLRFRTKKKDLLITISLIRLVRKTSLGKQFFSGVVGFV